MYFLGISDSHINDLPTIRDREITIDLDELKNARKGKMDKPVRISIPFPKLLFWDRKGVGASYSFNPSGLDFALNITTKQFIEKLERLQPRDNEVDRLLGHNHVVDVLLNVDYDAEKDEGIISIKCNDRLIHIQDFSVH